MRVFTFALFLAAFTLSFFDKALAQNQSLDAVRNSGTGSYCAFVLEHYFPQEGRFDVTDIESLEPHNTKFDFSYEREGLQPIIGIAHCIWQAVGDFQMLVHTARGSQRLGIPSLADPSHLSTRHASGRYNGYWGRKMSDRLKPRPDLKPTDFTALLRAFDLPSDNLCHAFATNVAGADKTQIDWATRAPNSFENLSSLFTFKGVTAKQLQNGHELDPAVNAMFMTCFITPEGPHVTYEGKFYGPDELRKVLPKRTWGKVGLK